jgi:hypothetical protein
MPRFSTMLFVIVIAEVIRARARCGAHGFNCFHSHFDIGHEPGQLVAWFIPVKNHDLEAPECLRRAIP